MVIRNTCTLNFVIFLSKNFCITKDYEREKKKIKVKIKLLTSHGSNFEISVDKNLNDNCKLIIKKLSLKIDQIFE